MDNIELMKQGYQHFADGNVEAVLALWDPAIEWNECPGMPFITGDGRFTGPQAVVEHVFAKIPEYFDGFAIAIEQLLGSGDQVVMVGTYHGKLKSTGKVFNARTVHVWTVKNGKCTRMVQVADTVALTNP